jgi:hypothetical protein
LEPSEIVYELSELPHLSSLSPSQRSWSLLVRRVRPPPAPPWSLQLMAVRDVQQGPAGGLSSSIWWGAYVAVWKSSVLTVGNARCT